MRNMEREMMQEAQDAKDAAKAEKAYNKASSVPPKPATKPTTKKYAKGGMVRGDGIAQRGKTRGKMC